MFGNMFQSLKDKYKDIWVYTLIMDTAGSLTVYGGEQRIMLLFHQAVLEGLK